MGLFEKHIQPIVLCNLIAVSIRIRWKFEETSVVERPFHLAIGVLLLTGLFWSTLAWISKDEPSKWRNSESGLLSINPSDENDTDKRLDKLRPGLRRINGLAIRLLGISGQHGASARLVACVVLRMILLRGVILEVQCSRNGIETFLPFLLVSYEALTANRFLQNPTTKTVSKNARSYHFQYAAVVGVFTLAAYSGIKMTAQPSTYICPKHGSWHRWVPIFQYLGLLLDIPIILGLSSISRRDVNPASLNRLLGALAVVSAAALSVLAGLFILKNPEHMVWSFYLDSKIISDLLQGSFLCSSFIVSVVYLMRDHCPSIPVTVASYAAIYTYHFASRIPDFWPPIPGLGAMVTFTSFFSAAILIRLWQVAARGQRSMFLSGVSVRIVMGLFFIMTILFLATKSSVYFHPNKYSEHPITMLISQGRFASILWRKQAGMSPSLEVAVNEYRERYGIPPPPNFDKWYEFATKHGSFVIDDYQQINDDLLPFWGVEPSKIREMTGHMLEHPWTEVGALSIFNGTVIQGPHVADDHRWQMEGTQKMLTKFVKWLPDMNLAFNINDESRVIIPWSATEDLKRIGTLAKRQLGENKDLKNFTQYTRELWPGSFLEPEPAYSRKEPSRYFAEASIARSFTKYSSMQCAPNSLTKTASWWQKQSFCAQCVAPHSLGPFISNWTLSGSICHQPDLANLHGFHSSPASFKPTTSLFPIFSQGKLPGYSDILFPSPWNYMDKVIYNNDPDRTFAERDMAFEEKQKTIFWRGATSEGYAIAGNWEGMQRQRFVHLMNTTTNSTQIDLLLPRDYGLPGYEYRTVNAESILSATKVDVSFVNAPVRCYGGRDCVEQFKELPFGGEVDFQDHWQYKYLFDFDGAGMSGRLLPFLQSRSCVFRASAIRQWFDERLTAWRHFVPVDPRMHDVWGLIAYFGGVLGEKGEVGHERAAELIAEDGKGWAERVLRKEDMEIYMFRLLLEWGRIVDDRRNELGYVLPPHKRLGYYPSEGAGKEGIVDE